mmetsp:Transcript_4397/g.8812  ORF Transcript_4397/g.8812 Transcript_4397/m.8812 type:complete len:494 (+) Transcript_4397:56-1537(+)
MAMNESLQHGSASAWCGHYRSLGHSVAVDGQLADGGHPLPKRNTVVLAANVEDGKQTVDGEELSVDQSLILAGGWSRFQVHLAMKVAVICAFIGVDSLLAVFLAPALGMQWGLSLVEQQLISSTWFAFGILGFVLSGSVADTYGRRTALVIFALLHRIGDLLTFAAPSFQLLLVARGIAAVGGVGTFNVCYPLLVEYSPPKRRAKAKLLLGVAWNAGVAYLVVVAFAVRTLSWRYLGLAVAPGIVATMWLLSCMPESPRFLLVQGRNAEARAALEAVAIANGATLPVASLAPHPTSKCSEGTGHSIWSWPLWGLFASRQRAITVGVLFVNFACSAAYYGLTFAPPGWLGGRSVYWNQFSATLLEVPVLLLAASLVDKLGRRWCLASLLGISALASLSAMVGTSSSLRSAAALLGRCSGQAALSLKWIISAENFPTSARGVGMALSGIVGSLGSTLGPLVFATMPAPFSFFVVLCMAAAVSTLKLPETARRDLS